MGLDISSTARVTVLITFILYIVAVTLIGVVASRRQKSGNYESGFFAGGRSLGGLALGMMMMATLLSGGTFVSSHGLTFRTGWSYGVVAFVAHLSLILALGGTGLKIGIMGRRTGAVSFIGLLKNRYNNSKAVVLAISLPMIVFLVAYSASQVISGARMFEAMTGSSYVIGLILFGAVVGIYTLLGGMKSVAATSIFQGFIMVLAVFAIAFGYFGWIHNNYGTLTEMMTSVANSEGSYLLAPIGMMPAKQTFSLLVMFSISSVALPHVAQGSLTYKDMKSLKRALLIGSISSVLVYFGLCLVGIVVYAANPALEVADYCMPYLAFLTLPPAFVGVMLSAVAAAIQSTVASMMLIVTAAICKDLIKDLFKPDMEGDQLKKITPVVLAIVCVVVVAFSLNPPDAVQLLVNYAIGGLASALFFPLVLGLYWRRANEYGAIVSVLVGFIYFIVGSSLAPQITFGLNAFVPSVIASGICMFIVSRVTPQPPLGIIQTWFGKNFDKEFATRK